MSTTKRLDMPLRGNLVKHIFPIEMYFLVVHSWPLPSLHPCTMQLSIEFTILKNLRLSWILEERSSLHYHMFSWSQKATLLSHGHFSSPIPLLHRPNFFYQGYSSCFHRDTIFNMVVVCVKRLFVIAFMIFRLDKFFNKI
jgi:hypothetical protein